ncbi:MAG: outer membrane beta-barrel domain-containing protein [bacterium]
MKKWCMFYIIIILLFITAVRGYAAEDADKDERVYAIQNKVFHRYHEFGITAGYIPDDDFFELFPLGINYIFHFNDHFAWEVARGYLVMKEEKDIKKDLEKEFGVTPSEFSKPKYIVHSHLVWKPMYGKDSILNKGVVNHESYFYFGGGMISYERLTLPGVDNALSLSAGFGIRYFINKYTCINFEIRDLVNFKEDDTENNLWCALCLGFRFNLRARKPEDNPTIKILNHYLREDENEN